jgi:hypothetical protein
LVTVEACDTSGECTSVTEEVDNTFLWIDFVTLSASWNYEGTEIEVNWEYQSNPSIRSYRFYAKTNMFGNTDDAVLIKNGILGTSWSFQRFNDTTLLDNSTSWYVAVTPNFGVDERWIHTVNSIVVLAYIPPDLDKDGIPDYVDDDDDGDGVKDAADSCPRGLVNWTSTVLLDEDLDGCNDVLEDPDDDNDGWPDDVELACGTNPANQNSLPLDIDNDGICDGRDGDRDGDGFENSADAFPDDANENNDTDSDGYGDNSDDCPNNHGTSHVDRNGCIDQDGDGVSDFNDAFWMFSSVSAPLSTVLLWVMIVFAVIVAGIVVMIQRRGIKSEEEGISPSNIPIDGGQVAPIPESQAEQTQSQAISEHQQWTDEQGRTWRRFSDGRTEWWNGKDWQEN